MERVVEDGIVVGEEGVLREGGVDGVPSGEVVGIIFLLGLLVGSFVFIKLFRPFNSFVGEGDVV